jgi:hypothetical protein
MSLELGGSKIMNIGFMAQALRFFMGFGARCWNLEPQNPMVSPFTSFNLQLELETSMNSWICKQIQNVQWS